MIAVAGYHEVLVHKADGSGIVARLVGLAERIQKLAWSPDGKKIARHRRQPGSHGRNPNLGRGGEEARALQIADV
jgi:dipeptidyl aminopeptidase/acylaminoacyl peptidase